MAVRIRAIAAFGLIALATACGSNSDGAGPAIADATTSVEPARPPSSSPSHAPSESQPPSDPPTTAAPTPSTPAPASTALPAKLLGTDWERVPTQRKVVALTFDGGASNDAVASTLATLSTKQVPATFFVTGDFAAAFPESCKAIARAGHRIGNHSMTHPYFTELSNANIRDELGSADEEISGATGHSSHPFFRFPYGDRDDRSIQVVNDAGYVPIRWTVDTLGWQGTSGGQSVNTVLDRVMGALRPGEIVLMHVGAHPTDHSTLDADALPKMIDMIRAEGYTFVSLDAML